MATTTTMTLGDLIEDTLSILYRNSERPFQVTVGSDALASDSDVSLTISSGESSVSATDLLENGQELMLVTAKSSDATPVFTVSRGYTSTTKANAATGDTLLVNPTFSRRDISEYIQRSFKSMLNTHLPYITSDTLTRVASKQYISMPATTVRVFSVRHVVTSTGRIVDVGGWQFEEDLPTSFVSTGKALRVPSTIDDDDDLIITYQTPYSWSDTTPTESSTIGIPLGAEDIPALWAAAYAVTRREVQRGDLEKIEEWNQDQAMRQGVNLRWARELWGEVYRRIDDAKRLQNVPKYRPFRKIPNVLQVK